MNHKLLFTLAIILAGFGQTFAQPTARVQVIHNSPEALAERVDVYLDTARLLDNFEFRTATSFIDAPAGVPITIGIALENSSSVNDTIASFTYTLMANETYVIVADGIVNTPAYSPAIPFDLKVFTGGKEAAANGTTTDVLVHHGSTDAPTVDVVEVGAGAGTIVNNAPYGAFAGYLSLNTADYVLEIRDTSGTATVASFDAPLSSLSLGGEALVVVASGFLDPSMNSNGPAFGLYVALPAGGPLVALPPSQVTGLEEFEGEISVYPNPASERLNLRIDSDVFKQLKLMDVSGRIVLESAIQSGLVNEINLSGISNGSYAIVLTGERVIATRNIQIIK